MKKQSGFGAVQIALIVVVLVLAGGAGWYVWQQNNKDETPRALTEQEVAQDVANLPAVSVDPTDLPENWKVERDDAAGVIMRNGATNCTVEALYFTDEQNVKPTAEAALSDTIASIEAKGYTVQKDASNVVLKTNGGRAEAVFGGASVTLTGQGSTLYQTYAFAVNESAMGRLQINCPNKADLLTSQEVVANIVFNKLFL